MEAVTIDQIEEQLKLLPPAKLAVVFDFATLNSDDVILCQITSQHVTDRYAGPVADNDFAAGGLRQDSNVRPTRLFTAGENIVLYRAGTLKPEKLREVIARIAQLFAD
jgi:mRNA interferase MazF